MAGRISGITIEIDGDTTKLGKALQSTNKDLKNTQSQLKEVERSLKFQPGNTELLGQKFRLLKDEVAQTEKKLATLKEADKQAKAQLDNGELGQEQYDALRREIIKTEDQLKSLKENADKTANSLKFAGWDETGQKIKKVGDGMQKVGTGMSKYLTAPIVAVGAASAKAWGEIDDGLDTITKKTGKTGEAAKVLEDAFNSVYSTVPASADAVANAVGEIDTQFGDTIPNISDASAAMVKFAEINGADVTQSVIGAKKSLEMFGLSGDDLAYALDNVTVASQNTGVSTDKIFESMRANAPILKSMGIDYGTAAQMVGKLEQSGLNADVVLKGLQKAQTKAASDGRTLSDAMADMSDAMNNGASETELLAKATDIFGTKNAPIMLEALKSGAIDMDAFESASSGAGAAVSDTFNATLDPVDKLKLALNNLKLIGAELWSSVQEVALPILENIVAKIKDWSERLREMDPAQKEMIIKIAMVAAAAGPLILVLGKIVTGVGSFISFVPKIVGGIQTVIGVMGTAHAAVFGIIGIIVAVIAALVNLYQNNEEFRNKVNAIWDAIKTFFIDTWNAIKGAAEAIWNAIKSIVEGVWNGLKTAATAVWNGIKSVITGVWNALVSVATTVWNGIKGTVEGVWNGLKGAASSVWNGIKGTIEGVWNGLKGTASSIWNGIKTAVMSPIEAISSWLANTWNGIKSTASSTWQAIKGAMTAPIENARNTIKGIVDRIKGFFSFKFQWPHIPLPHFGIIPQGWRIGDLLKGSIPRLGIQWYDKGGIFNSPAIVGVGEKRPEFVGALEDLKSIFTDALNQFANRSGGSALQMPGGQTVLVTGNTFYVRSEDDIDRVAEALAKKVLRKERGF